MHDTFQKDIKYYWWMALIILISTRRKSSQTSAFQEIYSKSAYQCILIKLEGCIKYDAIVLGTIFFNIFISDLDEDIRECILNLQKRIQSNPANILK